MGIKRVIINENVLEYLDDCVVVGEGLEGSSVDSKAMPQVETAATWGGPKRNVGVLGMFIKEIRSSPGSRLNNNMDDDISRGLFF